MIEFNDLDNFMDHVNGVKFNDIDLVHNLIHDYNSYLAVYACGLGFSIAKEISSKFNFNIMTEVLEDCEEGTYFIIDNDIHFVNRERFLFSKNKKQAIYQELIPYGEE